MVPATPAYTLTLFKKNHYPLLKKQVEMGRMLQVSAVAPRYHMTEDGRWDYRVTIVFKNAAVANEAFDEEEGHDCEEGNDREEAVVLTGGAVLSDRRFTSLVAPAGR